MKLSTFKQVLAASSQFRKRHVLLGNGFSIACRPNIFVYGKLFDRADFSKLSPGAKKAFDALETQDFERVIKVLRDASKILSAYPKSDKSLISSLKKDADGLREVLVSAIASSHPDGPFDLEEDEYKACRKFISIFDNIYTLNYDLLLYWAQMHTEEGQRPQADDGFRQPEDEFNTDYVTWEPHQSHGQSTWYLHGALHVFDTGTEIQKYTWSRTGIRLIDQIRDALKRDYFPLFVAEGSSKEKLEKIRHSDYLSKAYRSFSEITGALFVLGHSLAPNDEHFLKRIEQGKIQHLFVGIHGDPDSESNKEIISRANAMPGKRKNRRTLDISFFDSGSAAIWK